MAKHIMGLHMKLIVFFVLISMSANIAFAGQWEVTTNNNKKTIVSDFYMLDSFSRKMHTLGAFFSNKARVDIRINNVEGIRNISCAMNDPCTAEIYSINGDKIGGYFSQIYPSFGGVGSFGKMSWSMTDLKEVKRIQ